MDPQLQQKPGLGMPQPPYSTDGAQFAYPAAPPQVGSMDPAQQTVQAQQYQLPPIAPATPLDTYAATPSAPLAAGPQAAPAPPQAAATEQIAPEDEGGLLDREWVDKAKELVARTRTDPYAQSMELSRLKAQYVKARYNKDIKLAED